MAFNQDIKAIVLNQERILPDYCFWLLKGQERQILHRGVKRGATVHSLQSRYIENLSVSLPPLAEQRRIVDILNRADGIRRLRREAQEKARQIIPALFVTMFGDPAAASRFVPMSDLMVEYRYGTSQKSTPLGRPALRIPNIVRGSLDLTELKTVDVSDKDHKRLMLQDGDILFVRTNGNPNYVGRCSVFSRAAVGDSAYDPQNFIYASYLIRGRPDPAKINPIFLQVS